MAVQPFIPLADHYDGVLDRRRAYRDLHNAIPHGVIITTWIAIKQEARATLSLNYRLASLESAYEFATLRSSPMVWAYCGIVWSAAPDGDGALW